MALNNHDVLVAASKNAAEKWRQVPAPQWCCSVNGTFAGAGTLAHLSHESDRQAS